MMMIIIIIIIITIIKYSHVSGFKIFRFYDSTGRNAARNLVI